MPCVLFLDDDHERHHQFRERMTALGCAARYELVYVHTASDAIRALDARAGDIAYAFLDHDLSEADILVEVGAPTQVPTGMAVVEHILTMAQPPRAVVVHKYNFDAAHAMCARLQPHAAIAVKRIPFAHMITQLAMGGQLETLEPYREHVGPGARMR